MQVIKALAKPSMILVSRPAGGTPALPATSSIFFRKGVDFGDPSISMPKFEISNYWP
jgi:hypothetical protein